jgi:hypothetical protein
MTAVFIIMIIMIVVIRVIVSELRIGCRCPIWRKIIGRSARRPNRTNILAALVTVGHLKSSCKF